ncbi:pentapeptide repeat-containing protein [Ornithinimicrobium ciconiae]|uniref:Pentapeptide repeat-containing protein n=1 Tax=Ornithinimicrobium ciconiae TaxID=2594265 RepID=A0A516GEI3_9MICO|nr:pentapeptide repeat-containing protein [Ornithinimicrobium ciconiae]QDO89943.1 pentapeptide repeat-containing protein [Ornithinimicrobium ciconiae]
MTQPHTPRDPRLQGVLFVPLVVSVLIALALGAGVIVGAYWLVKQYLGIDDEPFSRAQAATAAFATATAAGAVVALVVGVRKQGLSEQVARRELTSAFTERFRAAASQLGGDPPAERIAGVYAMAALADDYPTRAQQCVDVLCGYLRLPFDPESNTLASGSIDTTHTFADGKTVAIHRGIAARPFDQQVRETIVTVIRSHLGMSPVQESLVGRITGKIRSDSMGAWADLDFDFAGAHLHNAKFTAMAFPGHINFSGTIFSGRTDFGLATFSGHTNFDLATFSGHTNFGLARFSGDTDFKEATFSGGTDFKEATFSGHTNFGLARFSGDTNFDLATFSGQTDFGGATFSGHTYVVDATFSGRTNFDQARFSDVRVHFDSPHPAEGARITGLREPILVGSASITSDGKPFRGWPPEDPEDSPTDVE